MNKVDEKELRRLYIEEKKPMHEVAKTLGVAIGTVYNYCVRYGIQTRNQKETFNFDGRHHTDETKRIISKNTKGKVRSAETRKRISVAKIRGGIGHKKRRCDGYIAVYFPDHTLSNKEGYIMEHDLVMECLIGRHLQKGEVVHHKNKKRDDNRAENLELLTAGEHTSLHMKERHRTRKEAQN